MLLNAKQPQQQQGQQAQSQLHHPQPPVPINGGSNVISGNNGAGTSVVPAGLKGQVPLHQPEEYPQNPSKPITDGAGGIMNIPRKNDQAINIFNHKDGGIMDETFGNHQQQQTGHNNL